MTDAHFHRNQYETYLVRDGREVRFFGIHPWEAADAPADRLVAVRDAVARDPSAGVGEIGLDRLRTKSVPDAQRAAFAAQLAIAAELGRPAVLHGAKCWGEVVKACVPYRGRIPAFLFHGFSRSGGLLPDIVALNGFVSVGPALCNDHAVNYRRLVKEIPLDRLLVETDADVSASPAPDAPAPDAPAAPGARDVLLKLAALRGLAADALEAAVDANAARFTEALA